MRRRIVLAALVTLTVSGVAACGGGGSKTSGKNEPPPKSGVNSIAATPRDGVKDGGQITWPMSGFPTNFNTFQLDGGDKDTSDVMSALLPGFYLIDAAGNAIWNKNYLASEPKLKTDPEQQITFDINPKAKWSDGTALTWEDIQWQWKANSGTDEAYKIASSNGWKNIKEVTKGKDDYEAVVTFKDKYADWQALFTGITPKALNKDPKTYNEGWVEKPLISAGPFKFDAIDKTAQTITLVRDTNWWGDKAKLDKIVFKQIDDSASADALANGEIDLLDIGANVNNYQRAKALGDKVELRRAGGPNFRHVTFNATSPALTDQNVRQALIMGIDRKVIGNALLKPLDMEPAPLNNHVFVTNHGAYKDNSGEIGTYSADKAKAKLDAAGWKLDGAVRKKDGKALELKLVIPSGVQAAKQESELIQTMLKQIGVTINISPVPTNDFFSKYVNVGQFDLTIFSWLGTAFPVSSIESIYKNPVKDSKGDLQIEQNYARVGSAEIDAKFKEANAELDKTKNQALGNDIDKLLWQEAGVMPMYQRPDLAAVKKDLVNFGAFAFASVVYEDIGFKK